MTSSPTPESSSCSTTDAVLSASPGTGTGTGTATEQRPLLTRDSTLKDETPTWLGDRSAYQEGAAAVSSTNASVDSDSDYRMTTLNDGSSYQGSNQGSTIQSSSLGLSANVSRSSSFSLLSTVAQKDGVQGKRVHKFHDPLAYSTWLDETNNYSSEDEDDDVVLMSSSVSKLSNISSGGGGTETEAELELEKAETGAELRADPYTESYTDEYTGPSGKSVSEYSYSASGEGLYQQGPEQQESNSNYSNYNSHYNSNYNSNCDSNCNHTHDSPRRLPNVTNGPPVTLNEKITLLRTGSVSGSFNSRLAENFLMSDPFTRSGANSIVSSSAASDDVSQF